MTVMTPNGREKFEWDETSEQFVPAGSAGVAVPVQSSLPIEDGVENAPTDDDVIEETQNEEITDAPRPS